MHCFNETPDHCATADLNITAFSFPFACISNSYSNHAQFPAMANFCDLRRLIHSNSENVFGPFACYVVNFNSADAPGRKYTYWGCTKSGKGGLVCGRPLEANAPHCGKHTDRPCGSGSTRLYKFEIALFDAKTGGPPIYATLFGHSAFRLLGMHALDFAKMTEEEQTELLHGFTYEAPLVNVWITVPPGIMPIVYKLERVPLRERRDKEELPQEGLPIWDEVNIEACHGTPINMEHLPPLRNRYA